MNHFFLLCFDTINSLFHRQSISHRNCLSIHICWTASLSSLSRFSCFRILTSGTRDVCMCMVVHTLLSMWKQLKLNLLYRAWGHRGDERVFALNASLLRRTKWHAQYGKQCRQEQTRPASSIIDGEDNCCPICIRNVVEPIGALSK